MEANNFRIGNLVEEPKGFVHKIERLDEQSERVRHGIPITEEYLLNFGLDVVGESGIMKQWNFGTNPLTKDYLFQLVWMKNINGKTLDELFYQNAHFRIKYVHQLQNLFFAKRLCRRFNYWGYNI